MFAHFAMTGTIAGNLNVHLDSRTYSFLKKNSRLGKEHIITKLNAIYIIV